MPLLKELQGLYNNKYTTNEIKSEAWAIRGITGGHFRLIVSGLKTNKKPFSEDEIAGCLQALKQAFKNDMVRRRKLENKIDKVA